jgi:acyl carrier protein
MGEAPPELTDKASFMNLGILDSTAVLEVIAFLEQTFHIKLAEDEMLPENLDSFDAIEAYVQRKRATV